MQGAQAEMQVQGLLRAIEGLPIAEVSLSKALHGARSYCPAAAARHYVFEVWNIPHGILRYTLLYHQK